MSDRLLARIIHEGSSPFDKLRVPSPAEGRKRANAKRDGHSEQGTGSAAGTGAKKGASPQQYVEGLNDETARHSRVSALAAEAS